MFKRLQKAIFGNREASNGGDSGSEPPSAPENQAKIVANELPWKNMPDEAACNFAYGHLVYNLAGRLTVDGRVHAETYVSAAGVIAGYAAQRTLFDKMPPVMGVNIHRLGVASGEEYWFGDALNCMLVPGSEADMNRCVWSLAAGSAVSAGLQPQQLPNFDAMFRHVASTIGGPEEGKSSVPANHQAHLPAKELLKAVWPLAAMCFSGEFLGENRERGKVPVAWWSAIAAQAASRPVKEVKDVLSPDIALTLLMESAIYCSKLDQSRVEATT